MSEETGYLVTDYAKMRNMEAWLRHPVLGDPFYLGKTVMLLW
jgi:hypothetical protein